jgi:hypothetical protein
MEKNYFDCLNETYSLFKSQGVSILGKGYEEIMSSPTLFEGYVASLCEGASADAQAEMAQLMANTNAHLLTEGSVAGIAPVSSLSGPVIRKLWPTFALKNAVKTQVAKTPSFLISYTRPYYITNENGVENRHYVVRPGLLGDHAGWQEGGDLAGNYKIQTISAAGEVDFNKNDAQNADDDFLTAQGSGSAIKRQPLDADFRLVEAFGKKVEVRLGVEGVIVYDAEIAARGTSGQDGYVAAHTVTVLVRADLNGGKAKVAFIGFEAGDGTIKLRVHRSAEYNEFATSWSFDIAREDVRIGTGEHMNSPLAVESLTDMKALYQIDGTKEAVDLMTNAMALKVDMSILRFIKDQFLAQPGHEMFKEEGYPGAAQYLAIFDVKPAVGFAGGPKAWREELKPVIDHLAARIKNQTFLGTGVFNIVANPLDVMLISNVDWSFRGGQQTVDGVSVNYSLGTYYGSAYAYKIVSSEIVPQGFMYIVFIPAEDKQMTYNYWAYSFSTELGYRDPNRALVPSIMLCKRDVMKAFMPAMACVKIIGNDAGANYDPFRDVLPTFSNQAGNATEGLSGTNNAEQAING